MDDSQAKKILQRYTHLTRKRDPMRDIFKLLSKYILLREVQFGDQMIGGTAPRFSVAGVSDDEVIEAARTSATALGGALWPHAAESFELIPLPDETRIAAFSQMGLGETDDLKGYWEKVTRVLRDVIDAPDSGFLLAWSEYMDDQPVFGTSGIYGVEDEINDAQPVQFRSVSIETAVIDEGADGLIDTVYLELFLTVRQMVGKYGIDNVSSVVREKFNRDLGDEYVKVVQAIEPRTGGKAGAPAKEKPYASVHVEVETQHVLKESGFDELPVFVTRFRKRPGELYGRSLGMDALPTVREMNVLRAAFTKALDKILDPPIGFWSEMVGGASTIRLSAGAKIALYNSGRIPADRKPVEPLITVQEPRIASERLAEMVERVRSKFLVDRLLDFNNKTRMTLGEAELRNDFRNQALNNIFQRQIVEMLNPLIRWVFKIMYRRGLVGLHPDKDEAKINKLRGGGIEPLVIPFEVVALMDSGRIPFVTRFISPAARAMKAESALGIESVTNYALTFVTAGQTDILDNIDADKSIRLYQDLKGAPSSIMRSKDEVEKIRKGRQDALAEQAQIAQQEQIAKTASHGAKAYKDYTAASNGQ